MSDTRDGRLDDDGNVLPNTSTKAMLGNLPDFKNELNLLQQLVKDLGHILISSPKCHPELAGDGIEYCWGQSKRFYRKRNTGDTTEMRRKQEERVFNSISPGNLPPARLMRYSRVAREYKLVYRSSVEGAGFFEHANIERKRESERLKRKHTSHRGIDASILSAGTHEADVRD